MKSFTVFAFSVVAFTLAQAGLAANTQEKGEISMKKAEEIATEEVSGKIKSREYEFEKGQNVYSFDIIALNGSIHEVLVGAKTGKIVSSTIESAAKEAAEEKADHKKGK